MGCSLRMSATGVPRVPLLGEDALFGSQVAGLEKAAVGGRRCSTGLPRPCNRALRQPSRSRVGALRWGPGDETLPADETLSMRGARDRLALRMDWEMANRCRWAAINAADGSAGGSLCCCQGGATRGALSFSTAVVGGTGQGRAGATQELGAQRVGAPPNYGLQLTKVPVRAPCTTALA